MALKIVLKPGEQLFVGASRIIVDTDQYVTFIIEGDGPVLRERDYVQPIEQTSKAREICLTLQTMYLTGRLDTLIDQYIAQVDVLLAEAPETTEIVDEINAALRDRHIYKALKASWRLVLSEKRGFGPG